MFLKKFDDDFNKIEQFFDSKHEFVFFGTGKVFEFFYAKFKNKINIRYLVDNNPEMQGKFIDNLEVKNPRCLLRENKKVKIIITSNYYAAIKEQLLDMGFIFNQDFCYFVHFMSLWFWKKNNELFLFQTDFSITSRCSFKCEKCNMLMPLYSEPYHSEVGDIIQDVDAYFSIVDKVNSFNLLGGEPFLHPDIYVITEYICQKYHQQIENLNFYTNGSVLPNEKLLRLMAQYNIGVQISDYSNTVNYSSRLDNLIQLMKEYSVRYAIIEMDEWVDFGSPFTSNGINHDLLVNHFDNCAVTFRGLGNEKLYYCNINYSAVRANIFQDNPNDYFDFRKTNKENIIELKLKLLKLDMGYLQQGYLTFCQYCNGCASVNDRTIKAGIQKQDEK